MKRSVLHMAQITALNREFPTVIMNIPQTKAVNRKRTETYHNAILFDISQALKTVHPSFDFQRDKFHIIFSGPADPVSRQFEIRDFCGMMIRTIGQKPRVEVATFGSFVATVWLDTLVEFYQLIIRIDDQTDLDYLGCQSLIMSPRTKIVIDVRNPRRMAAVMKNLGPIPPDRIVMVTSPDPKITKKVSEKWSFHRYDKHESLHAYHCLT